MHSHGHKDHCFYNVEIPLVCELLNEDAKGLISKTTILHVHHAFLYISLPSLQDYDVKVLNYFSKVRRCSKQSQWWIRHWSDIHYDSGKTFFGQRILTLYVQSVQSYRVYRYLATSAKHFSVANTAVDSVVNATLILARRSETILSRRT